MSTEITLALPDDLFERARIWADRTGRPINEFLVETLELSMAPLGRAPEPTSEWSNEDVLTAADVQLPSDIDGRLKELLAAQRESCLSRDEVVELRQLMLWYQEQLLRKAIGVREAVKRGLRRRLDA